MKKIKSILIVFIIILSFLFMFPENVHAELTQEQQKIVADFARKFVNEGNSKKILRYSQDLRTIGFSNKMKKGSMYFDCSSFASFVYNKTCNAGLGCLDTPGLYSSSKFKRISYSKNALQKGDLLCRPKTASRGGHVVIYIGNGKVAHASTGKAGPTEQVKIGDLYNDGFTILRYKGSPKNVKGYETYTWPDGTASNWNSEGSKDFEYNGTQEGTFSAHTFDFEFILDSLAQLVDWFIGITTYLIRMVFIGWSSIIEIVIDDIAGWVSGEEMSLTMEKLVNNKVPLLDVNFFNFATAGGQDIEPDSIIYIIRETIAVIYYIIRTVSIIGLLITLIYLGIRMALSNIAEEKAKYKQMLVSWLASFVIVFFIHYVMIAILAINTSLIELISASFGGAEESLYDSVRANAYAIQASIGWPSLIIYMILIYFLIRFIFIYIKRFLVVGILTFMAPILGISYSIDKIKDNKSQSLSNWLKEYTFNVLLQSVHALIYTLFISLAFNMLGSSIMGTVMAVLLINFMLKAEVLFKKIFGIKSGSIKDAIKSTAVIMGAERIAKGFAKMNAKAIGIVAKPITKPINSIYTKTKDYRRIDKINNVQNAIEKAKAEGRTSIKVGKNKYNIGKIINENNGVDSNTIAEGLVNNESEIKNKNKEEIKARMSQTLNGVLGVAQLTAAIPMTIVDGTEGLAMASNASKNLKKGINSYSKQKGKGIYDNKKYKGKSKVIRNARNKVMNGMTLGMYGAVKNISALNKDYNKNINKKLHDAQHEIAINKLEENIAKEYEKLINNPNIDRNELEEVLKAENKTIPKESIEKVIYRISAMKEIELLVSVNNEREEVISDEKLNSDRDKNKQQSKNTDVKENRNIVIDRNKLNKIMAKGNELNVIKQRTVKEVKAPFKKENIKFNEEKFEKSIDSQIKAIIVKEEKVKKSQISEKDIQQRFINMNDSEKQKVIEKAIYSSITVPKSERSNLKGRKTGMNIEDINEVINRIAEEKKVSMEKENCRGNFEVYVKESIANQKNKDIKEVSKEEINNHVSSLTNEELVDYIRVVGTYEDSIKRDENSTKSEYSNLVENIKSLRYHKENMKGN